MELVKEQPEYLDALKVLDSGECRQALPLLTVYLAQQERTEMVDYLLGRAYLCTGEFLKGAHHLRKAWMSAPAPILKEEIRAAAGRGAGRLATLHDQRGTLTYSELRACYLLSAFGDESWHSPAAVAALTDHAARLYQRGEYSRVLRVVSVMKRIGASPEKCLRAQAPALIKLGELEQLKTAVREGRDLLEPAGDTLYEMGRQAEESFRHMAAAWLYEQAAAASCSRESVQLDIARAYLKGEKPEQAGTAYGKYLEGTAGEARRARLLEVARLVEQFDNFDEAIAVLSEGRKEFDTDFEFYRALAALNKKVPDKCKPAEVFEEYLSAAGCSAAALENVGETCIEWNLPEPCLGLLDAVSSRAEDKALVSFYRGALHGLKGERRKAEALFDKAVSGAAQPAGMLDRVASFLSAGGKPGEARKYLRKALDKHGGSTRVLLRLATMLEKEKTGSGLAEIEKWLKRAKKAEGAFVAIAGWCDENGFGKRAVKYAVRAVEAATPGTALAANLVLGNLLLKDGEAERAVLAFSQAMEGAEDRVAVARNFFAAVGEVRNREFCCFVYETALRLSLDGQLEDHLLQPAALASIYCEKPDRKLMSRLVYSSPEPAVAMLFLLDRIVGPEGKAALIDVENERGDRSWDSPELAARLVELFASASMPERAWAYSKEYASASTTEVSQMVSLARGVLFKGSAAAAKEILTVAWDRASVRSKEDFGLLLASLLFSDGEEKEGLKVVRALTRVPGKRGYFSAAAASLLIDAGNPALAEELCVEALREPDEGPEPAPSLDEPDEETGGEVERDLLALLLNQGTEYGPDGLRGTLVALLAYAWREQGKDWQELVNEVVPLVEPWHGEHLVAKMLQKLGGQQQAVALFKQAFDESPARFDLLRSYVDSLVYQNYLDGNKLAEMASLVSRTVDRFIQARERDPEAYKSCAAYLEGKGFFELSALLFQTLARDTNLDARTALRFATALTSAGRFDEAKGNFRLATQLDACERTTLESSVQELERIGKIGFALTLTKECLEKYPRDASLYSLHARLLLQVVGKSAADEAVGNLKKAIALDESMVREAANLLYSHQLRESARSFVFLMLKSNTSTEVMDGIGLGFRIASNDGDVEEMTRLGAQAARLHKDDKLLLSEIAGLYFRYNLMKQGVEKLRAAVSGGAGDYIPLLLGIRLISMGKKKEGLKRLNAFFDKELLSGKPESGNMPDERLKTMEIQLDFLVDVELVSEAERLLNKALKLYPDDSRLRLRLMRVSLDQGRLDSFLEHLGLYKTPWLSVEERQGLLSMLHVLREAGRMDEAVGILERQCETTERSECLPLLAYALALDGNKRKLSALVTKVLRMPGLAPRDLFELGDLLLNAGRHAFAESLLVESIARGWGMNGLLAQAHRALCRLYSATGKRERIGEITRMVLLQTGSDLSLRVELPENLARYEYLDEGLKQLRLIELLDADEPAAQLEMFDILLNRGEFKNARDLAYRTAFQSESVLSLLTTFASRARRKLAFELAHDLYATAYELDTTNRPLLFAVAELSLVLDRPERARTLFDAYRADGPGVEVRTQELVRNISKYNYLGLARRVAVEARENGPMLALGLSFVRAGRTAEGTAMMLDALAQADDEKEMARSLLSASLSRTFQLTPEVVRKARELGCSGKTQPTVCRFWRGLELLDNGDVEGAAGIFGKQLLGSSETWAYTLASFRALVRKGHPKEAKRLLANVMVGFNRLQVLNEAVKTIFDLMEEEHLEAGAKAGAAALCKTYVAQLLKTDPYDFWFRTQAAEMELLAGNKEEALSRYEKFLERTPWEPGLYNNLAYLLSKLNVDIDRGLELVETALRREPSHSTFYLDTEGWLLYRKGKGAQAEELVKQAVWRANLGFGRSLSESLYHLGTLMQARGDEEGAKRNYHIGSFMDAYGEYGRKCRDKLVELGEDPFRTSE